MLFISNPEYVHTLSDWIEVIDVFVSCAGLSEALPVYFTRKFSV